MSNDKSKSFDTIEWARSYAPTVLKSNGAPDGVAMHVLLTLATHADGATGKNARPSQDTLATETRLSVKTVARKLADLEEAGLIVVTGLHGPVGWQVKVYALQLDRKREDDGSSAIEAARKQAAAKHKARQKKYRDALRERHAMGTVTPPQGVTQDAEPAGFPKSDALARRHVTPSEDARDALGGSHVTPSEGEYLSVDLSVTSQEDLSVSDGRSTGRAASGSKLPGCAATADAVPEEEPEEHWADKLADEDPSLAVVVESKDGEDEELAAEPVSEVADGPEMDQFMRDALEAEKEQQARYAAAGAASAGSPGVPAAPQAQMLTMAEGVAEAQRIIRASGSHAFDWWTPNQIEGYLRHPNEPRAAAQLRKAKLQHLPARISA